MAQRNKSWMDNWVAISGLFASGGQGKVMLVQKAAARGSGERFVLKVLKSRKDPDRRGRMHREVAALRRRQTFTFWEENGEYGGARRRSFDPAR
jgi:hypothetical protein